MRQARKRRWFRYGLRTILLLVALVAVILGYSVSRFARQRAAVESILARHGTVVYHDDAYGRVHPERTIYAWFREFVGLRWPGEVYLEGRSVTDDVLRDEVLPLRTVTAVGLTGVSVTNEGLAQLRPLESLASVTCIRDSRNERVLETLDNAPSMVDMRLAPLKDAMDYLTDLHEIAIQLDKEALQQQTAPITANIKNQPLSVTLEQLLAPLDLGYIVEGGKIIITTRMTAEDRAREADAVRAALPQIKTLVIDRER
jgi:hypothetical protein